MSRDLPPNPNLEHLKKQAKALLEQLRQQAADATLSGRAGRAVRGDCRTGADS